MTQRQKKQSIVLLAILAILTTIAILGFQLLSGGSTEKILSKSDMETLLNDEYSKDKQALMEFQNHIEKIFDDQLSEEIEISPICTGIIYDVIETGKTIVKIKRLDGYVAHINSMCYKTKLFSLIGVEKVGLATKDEIDLLRKSIWDTYFDSPAMLEKKLNSEIQKLILTIEKNHENSYNILNSKKNKISMLLGNRTRFTKFDQFLKRQENFNIATMVTVATTRYTIKGLTNSLSKLVKNKMKVKVKNIYVTLLIMLGSYAIQNEIQGYGDNELKLGISSQLNKIKNQFLYGNKAQEGWIYQFKTIIKKYQDLERKTYNNL